MEWRILLPKRGLVIYPYIPHYRAGVFRRMDDIEGYDFHFVACPKGVDGIRTITPTTVRKFSAVNNRRVFAAFWQSGVLGIVRRTRPDFVVVLADYRSITSWVVALWCRITSVPVFFWAHGWTRTPSGLRDAVKRIYFSLADLLLLYGNNGREFGIESGFPEERMAVIFNSIESGGGSASGGEDNSMVQAIRKFSSKHWPIIGAVARLQSAKSPNLIIEAASELRKSRPEYREIGVLLVGEGPELESLTALAGSLQVPLLAPGASYDPAELAAFYKAVDVSIIPDRVGLTGIQSMSFGVPVISNDSVQGQMPEWEAIRPGETGDYFPAGDVVGLSEAIARVIEGPSLEQSCVQEYLTNWSPTSQTRRIESVLNSFFGNR